MPRQKQVMILCWKNRQFVCGGERSEDDGGIRCDFSLIFVQYEAERERESRRVRVGMARLGKMMMVCHSVGIQFALHPPT